MMNRNGDQISAQISVAGEVTFGDKGSFRKDAPFCLKNDGEAAIFLQVNLWGMEPGQYVNTRFETGWNPEIIREVVQPTVANSRLLWGY